MNQDLNRNEFVLEHSVPFDAGCVYRLFRGSAVDIALYEKGAVKWLPLRIILPQETGQAHHRSLLLRVRRPGGYVIHCLDTTTSAVLVSFDQMAPGSAYLVESFVTAQQGHPNIPVDDGSPEVSGIAPVAAVFRFSDTSVRVVPRRLAYVPGSEACGHFIGRTHETCSLTLIAENRPSAPELRRLLWLAAAEEAGLEASYDPARCSDPLPSSFAGLIDLVRPSLVRPLMDMEATDPWWDS